MLILRIRQAETALADGRLDEACDLARDEDLRSHRRGQDLLGRLVKALIERGRGHLDAGRIQPAFADAQKAYRLGGGLPEVAALQAAVAEVLSQRQQAEQQRADAAGQARRHLQDGQLSMAEGMLTGIEGYGQQGHMVLREAAARRAGAEPAIQRAAEALEQRDWDVAIRCLTEARRLHASNPRLPDLAGRITRGVLDEVRASLDVGRVDRAEILLDRVGPLAGRTVDVEEAVRIIGQCRLAADRIARGRPHEAEQALRQLAGLLPGAGWIGAAIEQARAAAEAVGQLRTGPLGLIMPLEPAPLAAPSAPSAHPTAPQTAPFGERPRPVRWDERAEAPTERIDIGGLGGQAAGVAGVGQAGQVGGAGEVSGQPVPERFMLHVDGVGSYLVVRGPKVTIGAAGASGSPDVPLLAESGLGEVTIERADEDYFLKAARPVIVDDRPVTEKLLADGDRIALSTRCRVRFGVPNAASTSAVLQLSGTRLPKTDARRVILMDREVVIGPGAAAHIRADQMGEPVVLYVRDGWLCCRASRMVMAGEQALAGGQGLPLDTSVRVGAVSMVVTAAQG